MPDDPRKPPETAPAETPVPSAIDDQGQVQSPGNDRIDRGLSDFVRRAVSAGVGAAARSKDDIMRVAAAEMRTWLEHMNLNDEIAKALANMVIEVKTEIRFRPSESGKMVPQTTNEMKIKGSSE